MTLRRIADDLWETSPFVVPGGPQTHAYLWTPPSGQNVLFYSVGDDADLGALEERGGVAHQYLSHRDEAGPMLVALAERFGTRLHAPAGEARETARFREPDVLLTDPHVDGNGVEVVPTPGHSPASTCYVVHGIDDRTYLFTGDTLFTDRDGRWRPGFIPGISDARALAASIERLADLAPDVVLTSAFSDRGAHEVDPAEWPTLVRSAGRLLPAA
jgi:hydroxyacylglutathione hydrolase